MFQFVLLRFPDYDVPSNDDADNEATKKDEIEVGCRKWLEFNTETLETECKWPPGNLTERQLVELITKQADPEDTWEHHRCEIVKSYCKLRCFSSTLPILYATIVGL